MQDYTFFFFKKSSFSTKILIRRFLICVDFFINKINQLIDIGEKNILVGAIPRSGKSYIMAGTILEYVKKNISKDPTKKFKFLMMTPAPNETFGEYNDIFSNYIEFSQLGIDVITYKDGVKLKDICKNRDKHCVIVMSKQKLGWSSKEENDDAVDRQTLEEDVEEDFEEDFEEEDDDELEDEEYKQNDDVKNIEKRITKLLGKNNDINVMFLDEAHFGMTTEKTQQIVNILDNVAANTVKIYVTATYNKPLLAYGVKQECKLTWDMNDIKIMKNIDVERNK